MSGDGYFFDLKRLKGLGIKLSEKAMLYIARDLQSGVSRILKKNTQKKPNSLPGQPPLLSDADSPLKTLVAFNLDKRTLSLKVGPMIFRDSKGRKSSPAPNVLEKGGTAIAHVTEYRTIVHKRKSRPKWFVNEAAKKRAKASTGWKVWHNDHKYIINKPVHVAPRPFVSTVFKKYLEQDGVRKAIMRARGQTWKKGYDSKLTWNFK